MFLCHQKRNFLNLENGVAMTHRVFLFYPYNFYLMLSYFIGDCKKIPLYSQNCHLGSTSCKPYFYIIFCGQFACVMWVSVLKICILSVFEQNNVQRWLKCTLFIINTFVFHYVQEFGNKRNNLEGHINQKKSHSFEYKSPLFTLNARLETFNCLCISCKEQKIM